MDRRPDLDAETLTDALSGADARASEILRPHLTRLHHFLSRRMGALLRRREAPEDLVQSVCRRLLEDIQALPADQRRPDQLRSFIFRRAFRFLLDRHRYHGRQKRDAHLEQALEEPSLLRMTRSASTPSAIAIGAEQRERVRSALAHLPPQHREVLELSYFEGLSNAAIAEKLGASREAVESRLVRAMAKLAVELRAEGLREI